MDYSLSVSSSPHIRSSKNTSKIMLDVIIALIPATIAGIYFFGLDAFLVILTAVISSVVSEYIWNRIIKRKNTVLDLSAAVTGLLLGLNLSPKVPLWLAAIGSVFAIIIVKQLFGGLGQNFVNPALAARVFLVASWPSFMTTWIDPKVDAISSATPLALIKGGGATLNQLPSIWDLFIGNIGGCIGETSSLALILGGIYLLARKIISPEIPLTFIGTVAVFTWILGGDTYFTGNFVYHILSGGLMIGAFFMATDYTTSPITPRGRVIMGIGCGLLTSIIRLYGGYPEGVSFSILLMNLVVPLIDRYTIPKSFGGIK